ncbi:MAG: SsrA-binding protein SmpB [Rhodospirillaceae bacterium]|nr:SsrA-binding protein SmpB [Rhodospirillaceae bacterium]
MTVGQIVARNRRARYNYNIEETVEAGLQLLGSEVKSLRDGRASIGEAYAEARGDELYLVNAHIPEYPPAEPFNHAPTRPRKLLLRRRELRRLAGQAREQGVTLIPLSLYFNDRGRAKLELALASGKRRYDKRQTEKKRDWQRSKARLLRERG